MKTLQFDSQITNVQKMNPLFSSCSVRVLYTGVNRNGSDISKEVVDKAIGTIYNIPIVGEFIENKDDFGSHGGKIEISDQGIKMVQTTVPYGLVPESANIYWEEIEENGTVRNYLNIDGAILWTGRYEDALKAIEEGRPQSMEIQVVDGDISKDKVYEIKDMVFSALCILGEDVEACFESASIKAYSLDKDKFKKEFNQMIAELKFSLKQSSNEGGKKMEEKELVQENQFEVSEEGVNEVGEVEVIVEDSNEQEFKKEDKKESDSEPDGDEDGKDTDDDGDGKKDEKYELLESEIAEIKEKYSLLESEVKELREYKAQKLHAEKEVEINEVFESVSSELTEDELSPFKEKAFEMEIDTLKKELYALIGQKAFESKAKFSANKSTSISMSIIDDIPNDTPIANSYDEIIKKYNNK